MMKSVVRYVVDVGSTLRGIVVDLDDPSGLAPHLRRIEIDDAAGRWSDAHPDARLRPTSPSPDGAQFHAADLRSLLWADGAFNEARFHRHLDDVLRWGVPIQLIPRPSGIAEGRELFGREDVIAAVRRELARGSCHLRAPRRYGKTSLLTRIDHDLAAEQQASVFIECTEGATAAWLFVQIAAASMDRPGSRTALAGIEELRDWPAGGAEIQVRSAARDAVRDRATGSP